jgi:acyl-CoA thioester hydrolase
MISERQVEKKRKNTVGQGIRFNQVDSLGIVWCGHFMQYFEAGRETFGKEYNLQYLDFYQQDQVVPPA